MSNKVKVVFMKATRWAESEKSYVVGDTEYIPGYLYERWARNHIVRLYEGEKERVTSEEALNGMNLKELQKTAESLRIDHKGKNSKQLIKEIGLKRFYKPESDEKAKAANVIDEIKVPSKQETLNDLLDKKGDK